jgi:UDP-2,4-diacetamido-2,4,6-trideoxy-beta-L-altropyranose hydrolase
MKRSVFFRADGNDKIGRGHISRCVAVADMICNDFEITFVVLVSNESYFLKLNIGYNHHVINENEEVLDAIDNNALLWIDGYHFSEDFKTNAKKKAYKLIETNDIPYKADNVDVLVNHTPKISVEKFHVSENKVQLLLGLEYVLLREKFLEIARNSNSQEKIGKGVFICFGGADTFNLGLKFVTTLLSLGFKDPIYWVAKSLEESKKYSFDKNVHLMYDLDEEGMIQYMSTSKVVLIPSSVLSFEAIALRKPIFTSFFADNQELIYNGLIQDVLAEGCGYIETIEDVVLSCDSFMKYYINQKKHQKQIENQQNAIDGYSGERIKNSLLLQL